MGLLTHLLLWPVTGPLFLTRFAVGELAGAAERELTDDSRIREELLELQLRLELGEVSEEEYVRLEDELIQRLREVREWRERFGLPVGGGPVRVAPPEAETES